MSDFVKTTNDAKLFDFPKDSTNFKMPSVKISDKLQKMGFFVIESDKSLIEFKKYCDIKFDAVEEKFIKAIKSVYKNAIINSVKIAPKNALPVDLPKFSLKNISISKSSIKKEQGIFLATFISLDNKSKSVYFSFEIEAFLKVFISLHDKKLNSLLNSNDFKPKKVRLHKLPMSVLEEIDDELVAKINIKKDTILTKNSVKKLHLLQKGSRIKAILKDGSLSIQMGAKALNSGNKGDIIRIINDDGKSFDAIIENEKMVFIK